MVRTRYAPSPTGFMHVGNLRTALYEYLIAKHNNGSFILRIEDTDRERLVEGAAEFMYETLKTAGLQHDEGPDIGGAYGPYIQSERKNSYAGYARTLVEKGCAYYCFCDKERLESLHQSDTKDVAKYDRHCLGLSKDEISEKLSQNTPYVIRQRIPEGQTTFHDEVYGSITVNNDELDDQVLIKSDGMPTYNFANVIDDHLMKITHVVRGSEYLSSTPKYNLLYEGFGWPVPVYIHLPLILNQSGQKLAKRRGDANFEDLLRIGYLPEAIINFIALLGWSPADNREFFTLQELVECFDTKGLSKSPSVFDMQKLTWMNGEYIKKLPPQQFYDMVLPHLLESVKRPGIDLKKIAEMVQSRVSLPKDAIELVDFIDELPNYDKSLFTHKKMKTNDEIALLSLQQALPVLEATTSWTNDSLYQSLLKLAEEMGLKNSQILWPIRTALSGKPVSPCGATELAELLGKDETLARIRTGIEKLQ